jgi:hypothetical protein
VTFYARRSTNPIAFSVGPGPGTGLALTGSY